MTGQPLVQQLLDRNYNVRVIVRSPDKLSTKVLDKSKHNVKEAAVLDLTDEEMAEQVKDCDAVVSCLGHTLNFKGMFGEPKNYVPMLTRRLCSAIEKNTPIQAYKIYSNEYRWCKESGLEEKKSLVRASTSFYVTSCCAPHRDNETAAEHLYRTLARTISTSSGAVFDQTR